jgi:hypothetical protein
MDSVRDRDPEISLVAACEALGLNRSSVYRILAAPAVESGRQQTLPEENQGSLSTDRTSPGDAPSVASTDTDSRPTADSPPRRQPRALSPAERQAVLSELHSPRFADLAPRQVYAQLLEEGRYRCSCSTMYRILAAEGEVRERRALRQHPHHCAPHLCAQAPTQVWSSSQDAACEHCRAFFAWYNADHYHSGLGLLTPEQVHYLQTDEVLARRQEVLDLAYQAYPERFVNGPPSPSAPPNAVYINRLETTAANAIPIHPSDDIPLGGDSLNL